MPTKVYKDGCRCVTTEYEVREIDEHGDAYNIFTFEDKNKALDRAQLKALAPLHARVVEQHISRRPAHMFDRCDEFKVLATFGDNAALKEGGWL